MTQPAGGSRHRPMGGQCSSEKSHRRNRSRYGDRGGRIDRRGGGARVAGPERISCRPHRHPCKPVQSLRVGRREGRGAHHGVQGVPAVSSPRCWTRWATSTPPSGRSEGSAAKGHVADGRARRRSRSGTSTGDTNPRRIEGRVLRDARRAGLGGDNHIRAAYELPLQRGTDRPCPDFDSTVSGSSVWNLGNARQRLLRRERDDFRRPRCNLRPIYLHEPACTRFGLHHSGDSFRDDELRHQGVGQPARIT